MRALILSWLAVSGGCASAPEQDPVRVVSVDDVLRMTAAGVSPEVVAAHVRASHLREPLGTDRLIELSRDKKLDRRVLEALVSASADARSCPYCEEGMEP